MHIETLNTICVGDKKGTVTTYRIIGGAEHGNLTDLSLADLRRLNGLINLALHPTVIRER